MSSLIITKVQPSPIKYIKRQYLKNNFGKRCPHYTDKYNFRITSSFSSYYKCCFYAPIIAKVPVHLKGVWNTRFKFNYGRQSPFLWIYERVCSRINSLSQKNHLCVCLSLNISSSLSSIYLASQRWCLIIHSFKYSIHSMVTLEPIHLVARMGLKVPQESNQKSALFLCRLWPAGNELVSFNKTLTCPTTVVL